MKALQLIRKDNKFICSECRMAGRLRPACNFCNGFFSNYESLLAQIMREYETGYLTFQEFYDIIDLEKEKESSDDTDSQKYI